MSTQVFWLFGLPVSHELQRAVLNKPDSKGVVLVLLVSRLKWGCLLNLEAVLEFPGLGLYDLYYPTA